MRELAKLREAATRSADTPRPEVDDEAVTTGGAASADTTSPVEAG
jgi:hypothetical protein